MALPQILTDVSVTVATVAMGNVKKVTIAHSYEDLDRTVFGSAVKKHGGGLDDPVVTIEGFQDYDAAAIHATVGSLVNTDVAIIVDKDSTAVVSPTNPRWEFTGRLLDYASMDAEAGTDPMVTLVFLAAGTAISELTVS